MDHDNIILNIYEQEEKIKNMKIDVVDKFLTSAEGIMVVRSKLGYSENFIGSVTLKWVADNIKLYTELPLLRSKINNAGQLVLDKDVINELEQRQPKYSRQKELTQYLLSNKKRMFPPIVVVVQENWVNEPNSDEWDKEGKAKKTSMQYTKLCENGKVGTININNSTHLFVIDGAHRLLGIKGVNELRENGRLQIRKADGTNSNEVMQWNEISELYNIGDDELYNIMDNEQIGIQFIPAVIKGESRAEAKERTRSVFIHINKTAQSASAGEQVLLDEDDGFSIISRDIGFKNELFKQQSFGDRINWKSSSLPKGSLWLTTGIAIKQITEILLKSHSPYNKWVVKKKEISLRPDSADIDNGFGEVNEFWNSMKKLDVMVKIKNGTKIEELRNIDKKKPGKCIGHLLTRPIGQIVVAILIADLCKHENSPIKYDVSNVFDKIIEAEKNGVFSHIHTTKSIFYGLLYDPIRNIMLTEDKQVSVTVLKYVLGYCITDDEKSYAFNRLTDVRRNSDGKITNFDGTNIDEDKFEMPNKI